VFPHNNLLLIGTLLDKVYCSSHFELLPEERHASPDAHMDIELVVAFDYFFSFDKIAGVGFFVESSTIEPCSWIDPKSYLTCVYFYG
jgi:hypothetical protein